MPEMTLGPFPLGLDNVSLDTQRPPGTLAAAHNVLIDRSGQVSKRPGKWRLLSQAGMHSLWSSGLGWALCVMAGWLCRARMAGGTLQVVPVIEVGDASMSYCDFVDGSVLCANGAGIWQVAPSGVAAVAQPFALPVPAFTLAAGGSGGLPAGRYGVALAFVTASQEEGAASGRKFVDLAAGQGLNFDITWPEGDRIACARVYRTDPNGAELYRAYDVPVGMSPYTVGATTLGRIADVLDRQAMPAGSIIRLWRGRLLVAAEHVLWLSDPLRYGVTHKRGGFAQFPGEITVLEPVETGVYVGTDAGMFFLQGDRPNQWRYVRRGGGIPVKGTGTVVPSREFGGEIGDLDLPLAVWWSDQGLAIGLPDGTVQEPQSGRVNLPRPARAALGWFGRRVWMSA